MDPFRRLFLDHVEMIIAKNPGVDTLSELLKLVSPNLQLSDINDGKERAKLYKTLKLRVHPDKHPNHPRATKIFQDLDTFYGDCVSAHEEESIRSPRKKRAKRTSSPTSTNNFPLEFDVEDKWPYIHSKKTYTLPPSPSEVDISSVVAYQCINARGAIAHGNKTTLVLSPPSKKPVSASEVFANYGGFKQLSSVSDIKEELMNHGPVVSTSLKQNVGFTKSQLNSLLLVPRSSNRQRHPVLIVGWKHTPYGEVWVVRPFQYDKKPYEISFTSTTCRDIYIACGQYGIEDDCIAPKNNFEHHAWQKGPYFDFNVASPEWRSWSSMNIFITDSELERLSKTLEEGFVAAANNKSRIVVRDSTKIAHSRSAYLSEIKRLDGKWKVTLYFT